MTRPADRGVNSTGTGWRVTAQQETVGTDAQGRPAEGVRVSFTTDRGVAGSVFVTRSDYMNPANVQAAIRNYVQTLHTVADMTG